MGFHNHGYTLNRTHKKHNQQDPLNFKWVRVWFPQLGHALMRRLKKKAGFRQDSARTSFIPSGNNRWYNQDYQSGFQNQLWVGL